MPYPKFRETIQERNRLKEQLDALTRRVTDEYEPLKAKLTPLEQRVAELSGSKEEFDTLMWALEHNPDIRDSLYQRLGTAPGAPGPARIPPRPGGPPRAAQPAAALPPEVTKLIEEQGKALAEQRERTAAETRSANQARFNAAVTTTVDRFLTERQYDPMLEVRPGMTLRQKVLDFMADHAPDGGLEDVPTLLNWFYAEQEAMRGYWIKQYTDGKTQDRNLPAALPGGQPPLEISDKPLAISDARLRDQVKEAMRASGFGGA